MRKKHNPLSRMFSMMMAVALAFGLFPSMHPSIVSASVTTDMIYAAAYMGAQSTSDTTLPESIEINNESVTVNWHIGDDTFAVPYDTVTVTGMTGDGISVVANVEVIPPATNPLVYFVDSGRGGDSVGNGPTSSPFYEEVKALTGNQLVNEAADQKYVAGTTDWGFDDSQQKVKNSKDGNHTDPAVDPSKWTVGFRAANDHIIYKLAALDAGTYTISSGFHDWYGNRSRVILPKLQYQDVSGIIQTLPLDQFNTNATTFISSEFTIPETIDTSVPMTLTYTYVSGEKPILSWFAIAEGEVKAIIEDARKAAASAVKILLDGNDIKADNVNGLTFKGFGVLSANSTSALLMDYKSEQPEVYAEMLQILFGGENPLMRHVKIEMGNDRNNSTGPDPATMRTEDEEANVTRHPGFQLAADAKAVNPDLKVSILRWSAPAWANNNDKIYTWYKNTILAAYREYGYMADYVNPHINEHAPDYTWTKQYAARVKADNEGFESDQEQALYNQIQAVISDEVGIGSFGGSMVSDASLREAVPIAAYHYNTDDDGAGNFKRLAEEFDIEVWNSEAQATFSNSSFRPNNNTKDPTVAGTGIGGTGSALEMGNTIIKGFVNSRRTHFIYQPAIGSFYDGGQYSFKELLSARDPWSGWIHYDAGLVILQHFSWFANIGWENESNTEGIWRAVPQASYTGATGTNPVSGRNGTPSYMTLAAPDKSDFSTVIVNDSEYERTYRLQTINMGYIGTPSLEAWETRAADEGEAFNSNHMQFREQITADGSGTYTITVKPYSIVTVSTLDNKDELSYNTPLPVEGERTVLDTDITGKVQNTADNVLYADNFDYRDEVVPVIGIDGDITEWQSYITSRGGESGVIPRYTHDRNGAFEAYLDEQTDNYVLRQQLDRAIMGLGGTWNGGDPVTAIGDNRWTNYKASVDVSFENDDVQNGANYAAIGARYQGGGSSHSINGTPYVLKYWFDGGWELLVNNGKVASGNVVSGTGGTAIPDFDIAYDAWHNLAIEVAGSKVTAILDGVKLASYDDPNPKLSGRVDLASGYYHVRFDNLLVETVEGFTPYYTELLDDLEKHDLAQQPAVKLVYNELWNQINGQGMFHYQRSLSTSQGAGATLEYTFTGTGMDILGPNNGTAKLEVTVDGQVVIPSANTIAAKELYQTFALRGLEYGEHTVQIKVLSGTLVVDAVAVVSGDVLGSPDVAALQEVATEAQAVERLEAFTDDAWQLFESARTAVLAAAVDPAAYHLDQEGAAQLALRLIDAQNQLFMGGIQELSSPYYAATFVGELPNLPEKIVATQEDGAEILVAVNWNLKDVSFNTPYETVAVSGSLGSLTTVAYVEVVPKDIIYFVDINGTASALGYHSPAYEAVATLVAAEGKSLLNNAPDQAYSTEAGWGHGGRNASGSTAISYKGVATGTYSKQSTTGIYTSDQIGATLTYTFADLPAGDYTLTLGSYSWWSSYARTAEVYLMHDNESAKVDTITLNSNLYDVMKGYNVTLEEAGSLKLELKAIQSNQSPMLSFVGIAPVKSAEPEVNKAVLQVLYDEYSDMEQDDYTTTSWSSLQNALTSALGVLGNEAATQEQVNEAWLVLTDAVAGLEKETSELKLPTSYDQVVVATYVGEEPNLPTTISGKAADNAVVDNIFVEWNELSDTDFTVAFADTIEWTGNAYLIIDGSQERVELAEPVTAFVEVVPNQLKYFVDAGVTNPFIYNAVQSLAADTLLNDATNQVYNAASGWGYIALGSNGAVKPIINKSAQPDLDKHATGIMIDGGDPLSTLSYQFDGLEGGKSYRFTSYHRLWWGNEMPFKIAISYLLNGERVTQNINRLHLDHIGHSGQVSYSIDLPEGVSDVRYVLTNVGSYTAGPGAGKTNKNAAISWLAVEELNAPAETATYASLGGVAGENTEIWLDNNGVPIQAHGGQVQWVEHVTWDGDKPSYIANPDAEDGAWLWVGEDKTYGGRPIGGIHTYVSKDLYNWVDMGVALYPHRVFPMEKAVDGQSVQISQDQLTALKMRAMATAGTGMNELGETLTSFDIDYARDFLQAYVDGETHPSYSRVNDADFDYVNASYDEESLLLAFDRTYAYYTIMERPKMLYNDATEQYVIVYHVDGPTDERILEQFDTFKNDPMYNTGISRYSRAQMGFAVSDSPFGPFKLVNSQKMNYIEGYYPNNQGMARDMTVFKDDDGKAYAIYSSEENKYTYISLLNDSYTAPIKDGTEGLGETFTARVFTDTSREAPAIFKYNGYYYFITSGTTGWDPNPSIIYRANHIFGNTTDGGQSFTPYTKLGNPFPNDTSNTSYRTQSTAVIPYDPENGIFIYMGDRWIQRSLETSGYVWLPLQISANGEKIEGVTLSDWTLNVFDDIAPVQINSELPAIVELGATDVLPSMLNVKIGLATMDTPVIWGVIPQSIGTHIIEGVLPEQKNRAVATEITVLPFELLYFVNAGISEPNEVFQIMTERSAHTLINKTVSDQEYSDVNGWGYEGGNTLARNHTDLYEAMRYVASGTSSINYQFDNLDAGTYQVMVGFYDPWYQYSNGKRIANVSLLQDDVQIGGTIEHTISNLKDQVTVNDITFDQNGSLSVQIAPKNSGSDSSAQVSFIAIRKIVEQEEEEPQPDTTKPVITLLGEAIVQVENGAAYSDAGATAVDDVDGGISEELVTTITRNGNLVEELNTTVAGTYTYHYNVSDEAGNAADEVTRTVIVSERRDTSNPGTQPESPTPISPTVPTTTQVLKEADLKAAADGTVTIEIAQDKDTVLIPSDIAALIGDNRLKLIQNNVTIEFTQEVLDEIQNAVSKAQVEGAKISLTLKTVSPEDIMQSINKFTGNGTVRLALAGDTLNLGLEIITADGASKLVTTLVEPLIVTLKVDSAANLDLLGLYSISADGTLAYVGGTINGGVLVASINHPGQYVVLEYIKDFNDVSEGFWASSVIKQLTAKHIINGVSEQEFNPHGNVTRAEFAALIARALGLDSSNRPGTEFNDINSSDWYAGVVRAVSEAGIVMGRGLDMFAPNDDVTREEMAVMIVRAYEYVNGQQASMDIFESFDDVDQISDWAQSSVNIAGEIGLINGRGQNQFAPRETMTRAESAQIVYNLLKNL